MPRFDEREGERGRTEAAVESRPGEPTLARVLAFAAWRGLARRHQLFQIFQGAWPPSHILLRAWKSR